jgi:predicted  nucleic acid-binding Zn-ribbon protein
MQTWEDNQAVNISQNLYEMDFYAWTQQQADLLKNQQWQNLDLSNLIEEIASLGRKEQQELRNRLSILIAHLLKWEYQTEKRSRSWLATIRIQRREITKLLNENPSLKSYLETALLEAFENGRDLASGETNLALSNFPELCLYSWEEILSNSFYPGEPASNDLMD